MQQLVELARVDPRYRLLMRDHPLCGHLDCDAKRSTGRALACPRLQKVQPALLDRELDVLHVTVVALEPVERRRQLREGLRQPVAHHRDRLGRPNARDDVLALRVDEELAIQHRFARRRVAGEAHAGTGALALVAEHHLHDVHRRADVVGNLVGSPVDLGPRRVPGVEDRPVGPAQLLARVLREARADLLLVDPLERPDQLAQIVGPQLEVVHHPARCLQIGERALEPVPVDAVNDLAVHLDQAPVRVVGEPRVPCRRSLTLDGNIIQAQVQDRVHHPRHRHGGTGPHRDEQRVKGVAEPLPRLLLERRDVLADLVVEALGHVLATRHVGAARIGRDCEPGRHRHPERRHLGQADPLAAEEFPTARGLFVVVVDVAHVAILAHVRAR